MQQLWNVLGPEGSKYVVWLSVGIALLIGLFVLFWTGMRVFGRGLNMGASGRGQPQRLGITGAFNLDRKGRKLVIVRRDNVEHLLLIGGPNDVLVEASIIRAQRATARDAAFEAPTVGNVAHAPLETQVELPLHAPPAAPAAPPPRPVAPPPAQLAPPPPPVVAARPVAAGIPAQPQPMPVPPKAEAPRQELPKMQPPAPRPTMPAESAAIAAQSTARPASVSAAPPAAPGIAPTAPQRPPQPALPSAAAPEPRTPSPVPERDAAQPAPPPAAPAETAPVAPNPLPSPDNRLSDMARRLQSVLKSPLTPVPQRGPDPAAAAKAETIPIPLPSRSAEPKPDQDSTKGAAVPPQHLADEKMTQGKPVSAPATTPNTTAIDSLEEEMARLLGRPGPEKH